MRCPLTTRYINTTMEVTEKDWAIIADCHEHCAWWDKFNKQCAILTIAKEVGVKK